MSLPNYTDKNTIDANILADLADNFTGAITAQDVREIIQQISDSFNHAAYAQELTDAANIAWDLDEGRTAAVTLGGNRTIDEPTNARIGSRITLQVIQDATGNRTLTWDPFFVFDSTPTLSTGADRMDVFEFIIVDNGAGDPLAALATTPIIGVYSATGGSGGGPWKPTPT